VSSKTFDWGNTNELSPEIVRPSIEKGEMCTECASRSIVSALQTDENVILIYIIFKSNGGGGVQNVNFQK
jgi:hypothetical protein